MNLFIHPFFLLFLLIAFSCEKKQKQQHDLLIVNGTIYEGSDHAGYSGDIAVDGDRITLIAPELEDEHSAELIIDATGMAVTPGFIDLHAHLDPILKMPDAESHVRQGVTLALGGPDGFSPWPIKDQMDSLQKLGLGMNVAYLGGHNTIRLNVMGMARRPPKPDELEEMKGQVQQAMEEGAFGLSTGLKYLPGAFSNVKEVIELSKVASDNGGFYTSHLREEGLGLIPAVKEAIVISREADIPVVLTHHKAIGQRMWGKSLETLELIDSARAIGLDIMADQYPYIASYTGISVLIPAWARAGGAFNERVKDPVLRDSIKAGIVFNILNDRGGGDLDRIQLALVNWNKELEGKTLREWAEMRDMLPTPGNGAELVIEAQLKGGASCVYFAMDEGDVERIMKHPMTMIASDGRLCRPGIGHPHPRWYGTFPRVLGYYVREKGTLELKEAIRKMTGLPAYRLGLTDRGLLKTNNYADIVIFDPERIIDKATFKDPHQYSEGLQFVVVNGEIAVDPDGMTDRRAGRVLYGPSTLR